MPRPIANFSAGPAALPESVRQIISDQLKITDPSTPSIIEVSHRGREFSGVYDELTERLHSLLGTEKTHHLLFLQGGASQQFYQFPMNFGMSQPPGFLITGHWGQKALTEAGKVANPHVVQTMASEGFIRVPDKLEVEQPLAYLHYTGNETIQGVQFLRPPEVSPNVPLVSDLSSEFLSRPYPYNTLAGFYAGAQKNLGVAGLTIVGLERSWVDRAEIKSNPSLPSLLDYQTWIAQQSMPNTPCTFAWWVAVLILRWIEQQGGLKGIEQANLEKANLVYNLIDASDFFSSPVERDSRSVINIPFWSPDPKLDTLFVSESTEAGLIGLKGHRAVGGLRASLYNAIKRDDVIALVEFMREFERCHG